MASERRLRKASGSGWSDCSQHRSACRLPRSRRAHRCCKAGLLRAGTRGTWTALAAIPAGLVIAVTAYISTDIAAAPLLWVLPLALYLLTFVAVFRDKPWFSHDLVLKVVPFVVAPLAISLLGGDHEYW